MSIIKRTYIAPIVYFEDIEAGDGVMAGSIRNTVDDQGNGDDTPSVDPNDPFGDGAKMMGLDEAPDLYILDE